MTTAQALRKIDKLERELAAVKAEFLADIPYDDELSDEFQKKLDRIAKEPAMATYAGPGSLEKLIAEHAS
jgi:hypothetical protein